MGNPGDVIALYAFYSATDEDFRYLRDAFAEDLDGWDEKEDGLRSAPAPQPIWELSQSATDADRIQKVEEIIVYHQRTHETEVYVCATGPQVYDESYFAIGLSEGWKDEGVLLINLNEYAFYDGREETDVLEIIKANGKEVYRNKHKQRLVAIRQARVDSGASTFEGEKLIYSERENEWCVKGVERGYDACMFPASEIDALVVNMQIANMGYEEFRNRETYAAMKAKWQADRKASEESKKQRTEEENVPSEELEMTDDTTEEVEDGMVEIDVSNIIPGGRRTPGRNIDFAEAENCAETFFDDVD